MTMLEWHAMSPTGGTTFDYKTRCYIPSDISATTCLSHKPPTVAAAQEAAALDAVACDPGAQRLHKRTAKLNSALQDTRHTCCNLRNRLCQSTHAVWQVPAAEHCHT